jgi:6-phosphogluconolactonase
MTVRFEVVESVTDAFARLVADMLAEPPASGFSLFLSGGPIAEQAYRDLAALTGPQLGDDRGHTSDHRSIDWSRVDTYLGDERCVPPDDPDSNHRMVAEVFLDVVGPVRSDHPMYHSGPPDQAAAAYQREVESLDRFDLVHLGLGPDGHCASLFPDSAALAIDDPDVLVAANRDPHAVNPHDRITLTLPGIARASLAVFTVSGASKRSALAGVVAGDDLPAARVTAREVLWLIDADAVGDTQLPGGG